MLLNMHRSCVQKLRVFPFHIRAPVFAKTFVPNRYYTSIKRISLDKAVSHRSNSNLQPLPTTIVNLGSSDSLAALPPGVSFSDLGIRSPLVSALSQAFNITNPTVPQQQFISAILSGRDIFLRDHTGTGKTLGMVLALLNLQRATYTRPSGSCVPAITSLIIVPNRELAFQIESWAHALVPLKESIDFRAVMQVVAKRMDDAGEAEKELRHQIIDLQETPPHVLVGTPTQLMKVANENELFVSELRTVVLDEFDRTLPLRLNKSTGKILPRPVVDLLNYIFDRMRKAQSKRLHEQWNEVMRNKKNMQKRTKLPSRELKFRKPQVIAASATMKRKLRFFMAERNWINNALFVDITKGSKGPASTIHHCIMVSKNHVRNIVARIDEDKDENEQQNKDKEEKDETNFRRDRNNKNKEVAVKSNKRRNTRSNYSNAYMALDNEEDEVYDDDEDKNETDYDDEMLDNVVTACEFENVQRAILFVEEGTNTRSLSSKFQRFGITAHELIKSIGNTDLHALPSPSSALNTDDLGASSPLSKTSTTLLISTPQSARGIDIPNLTHVFILGRPYTTTDYLHMAGRTGRMGHSGKVISFVRDRGQAEKKMAWMYWISKINVQPYEHIE